MSLRRRIARPPERPAQAARCRLTAVGAGLLLAVAASACAADEDADRGARWRFRFSPAGDLYPVYVADPRRASFRITQLNVSGSTIAEAGDSRFGLRLGGRYGFVRLHPVDRPERGLQIDVEGGFLGQFDRDNSTDNLGWDGLYGIQLAWAGAHGLATRIGLFHDSSHVGDEYAERTGRRRLNYTRQEVLVGLSWSFAPRWRTYVEGGQAFDLRNEELMEPGRAQLGLEYERTTPGWGGRRGWYAALDVSAYEENDWTRNRTLQVGVVLKRPDLARTYRFGVEHYDGRSPIGEFFLEREEHFAFGFWFDL